MRVFKKSKSKMRKKDWAFLLMLPFVIVAAVLHIAFTIYVERRGEGKD